MRESARVRPPEAATRPEVPAVSEILLRAMSEPALSGRSLALTALVVSTEFTLLRLSLLPLLWWGSDSHDHFFTSERHSDFAGQ